MRVLKAASGQMMSGLTEEQVAELRSRYSLLINYEGDDPTAPIDPLTYRAADGDHLIHIAAFTGDLRTVEWLLDAGEDINAVGDMGETPAHNAASNLHKDVFELLVGRGADLTIKSEFGTTPIECWTFSQREAESKRF